MGMWLNKENLAQTLAFGLGGTGGVLVSVSFLVMVTL